MNLPKFLSDANVKRLFNFFKMFLILETALLIACYPFFRIKSAGGLVDEEKAKTELILELTSENITLKNKLEKRR